MKKKWIKTLVTFVICLAVGLLSQFIQNNYFIILIDQIIISIIVLMGLNFVTGMMGQMNLGTAGFMALGAYTTAILCTKYGMSSWLSMLFVILIGIVAGLCIGYPSLRIKGIYLALTTLGFSEIVRTAVTNMTDLTGGPSGIRSIPAFTIGSLSFGNAHTYLYLFLGILFILMVFVQYIMDSKWSRAMKAVADNDLAVESCGIKLSSIKVFAFALCCVFASIGGALYAHLIGYISPSDFTMKLSIKYLMMLMIGGLGSMGGNILGAILVTTLPELLRDLDNYYWLMFSSVMLLMSILVPNGLLSIFKKLAALVPMKKKKGDQNGGSVSN